MVTYDNTRILAVSHQVLVLFTILLTAAAIPNPGQTNLHTPLGKLNGSDNGISDRTNWNSVTSDPEATSVVDAVTFIIESIIHRNSSVYDPRHTSYSQAIRSNFVFNSQFRNHSSINATITNTSGTAPPSDDPGFSFDPGVHDEVYYENQVFMEQYLNNMVDNTDQIYYHLNKAEQHMWLDLKDLLQARFNKGDGVVLWNQQSQFWVFCAIIPKLTSSIVKTLVQDSHNAYPARICCPFDALGVGHMNRAPMELEDYIPVAVIEKLVQEVMLITSQEMDSYGESSQTSQDLDHYGESSQEMGLRGKSGGMWRTLNESSDRITSKVPRSELRRPLLQRKTELVSGSVRFSPDEVGEIDLFVIGRPAYQQTCK